MSQNVQRLITLTLLGIFLSGCSFSISSQPTLPSQTPTQPAAAVPTLIPTETQPPQAVPTSTLTAPPASTFTAIPVLPTFTSTTAAPVTVNICQDSQVTALIDSLKTSMRTSDGALLSSLVHPTKGMEVRWVRNGNVITYTREQAKFLFETTFEANWGPEPGSGQDKMGSFHGVIVPELVKIFDQSHTLHCKDLKHGGATYDLTWPYQGDYYSIYFPGTDQYGQLDWHTWVVGIEYVNSKPFIYALIQFFWEP
jgi:hypothetical protein